MCYKLLIILLCIILFSQLSFAVDINNNIDQNEYPPIDDVLPKSKINSDAIISGSVEKNIKMNLANCIFLALGNNPQINAAFQDILAADARIKQVWANYFPTFSWQTGYTRLRQLQLSDALGRNLEFNYYLLGQVSLQQMLYDFGVTQNQATIRRLDYENYRKILESTVNDVIFKTKTSYYALLYAYENLRIARETVENFELFYNQAKAYYISGFNPKIDVTIAQSNLSNAKLKLIKAENTVNIAIANLNNIMGLPYIEKYEVIDKLKYVPISINFENALAIARDSRPELKQAEIKVESLNQTIKLAKKSYLPTLSVEGQYQRGGRTWNSNYGFNIGGYLTFPAINLMLVKNEIREAKYLYDKELANAKNTQNNIYLEIQNAYLKLEEKRNQIPVALLQLKQAKENYNLSFGMYKVGETSPTELKDAEITYENAQLTYYSSLYEYNVAKSELEKSIGRNIIESDEQIELIN